jgi:hypothetical protein
VKFVVQCFCMVDCRPWSFPISMGTKISMEQCCTTPKNMEDMNHVPYYIEVGILMYVTVFTIPNIS